MERKNYITVLDLIHKRSIKTDTKFQIFLIFKFGNKFYEWNIWKNPWTKLNRKHTLKYLAFWWTEELNTEYWTVKIHYCLLKSYPKYSTFIILRLWLWLLSAMFHFITPTLIFNSLSEFDSCQMPKPRWMGEWLDTPTDRQKDVIVWIPDVSQGHYTWFPDDGAGLAGGRRSLVA